MPRIVYEDEDPLPRYELSESERRTLLGVAVGQAGALTVVVAPILLTLDVLDRSIAGDDPGLPLWFTGPLYFVAGFLLAFAWRRASLLRTAETIYDRQNREMRSGRDATPPSVRDAGP